MQINNDYVIIAKDVTTDSNDNMVSILKIVDNFEIGVDAEIYHQMNADDDKIFNGPLQFSVATSFSANEKANNDQPFELKVEIISPKNKKLWEFKQDFGLKKDTDRSRININIQGMPISGSGRYLVRATAINQGKVLAKGSTHLNVIISQNKK